MSDDLERAYDFARDGRAIEHDHGAGLHDKDMPWVMYRDGDYVACFDTFQRACEHGYQTGVMGRCTIRNAFDPPPSIPMLIVKDPQAILSFLDMDEAGVERIFDAARTAQAKQRVVYRDSDWNEPEYEGGGPEQIARAVLAELRKMAGEKEA